MNNGNNNGTSGGFGGSGFADSDPTGFGSGFASGSSTPPGYGSGFAPQNTSSYGTGSEDDYDEGYEDEYEDEQTGSFSGYGGFAQGTQYNGYPAGQGMNAGYSQPMDNGYNGQNGGYAQPSGNGFNGQNGSFNQSYGNDYNAQNGGSSFSQQDNYDPNAPLYHPESEYDPNVSLYRPMNNDFSSTNSETPEPHANAKYVTAMSKTKSRNMTILIVALVLVFLAIGGFILYKALFEKQSIKRYWEGTNGQAERQQLRNDFLAQNKEATDFDIYVEGEDVLVYEVTYNQYNFTSKEKEAADAYFKLIETTMTSEIQKIMSRYNIRDFDIVFRFKGKTGNTMAEYTYSVN